MFILAALLAPIAQTSTLEVAWQVHDLGGRDPVDICLVDGNTTVVAYEGPAASVTAFDEDGDLTWSQPLPGEPRAITSHPSGEVTVVGRVGGIVPTLPPPLGMADGYVSRFDSNGDVLWQIRVGGSSSDQIAAVDAAGEALVLVGLSYSSDFFGATAFNGDFAARIAADGTVEWATPIQITNAGLTDSRQGTVAVYPDGSSLVGGRISDGSFSSTMYSTSLSPSGQITSFASDSNWTSLFRLRLTESGDLIQMYWGYGSDNGTGGYCFNSTCGTIPDSLSGSGVAQDGVIVDGELFLAAEIPDPGLFNPTFRGLCRISPVDGSIAERIEIRSAEGRTATIQAMLAGSSGTIHAIMDESLAHSYVARLARTEPYSVDVCAGEPNSTTRRATLGATGTDLTSANDVTLFARDLPSQATTLFLVSDASGLVPNAGGSQGTLCLGGTIGRMLGPGDLRTSSVDGDAALTIDLDEIPRASYFAVGMPAETWYFQAWYRDANPSNTSNFTSALSVLLR